MKVSFGTNARDGNPVIFDSDNLINSHALVLGDTGSGKSTFLRRFVVDSLKYDERIPRTHLFDVHDDFDFPGAQSAVKFSESTDFGFNPLVLNTDPDYGGVRKRINFFVSAINRTAHKLGPKQEAALRNLLTDLYEMRGFNPDNPATWNEVYEHADREDRVYVESVYEERKQVFDAGGTFDQEKRAYWFTPENYAAKGSRWPVKRFGKTYPSIADLVNFAEQKLNQLYFGVPQVAMRKLDEFYSATRSLNSKKQAEVKKAGGINQAAMAEIEEQLKKAKQKVIDTFAEHINAVTTGRELTEFKKYDSAEVLKSVVDRIRNLNAIGIFRASPPPFAHRAPVWNYKIKALGEAEKCLFVEFRLEEIFKQAMQAGKQTTVTNVVILDEAHLFMTDEEDHIINRIIREGRKYGLSLILASQSPDHFQKELLAGVGTKVILGLDRSYTSAVENKMGIKEQTLNFIQARKRMVVMFKRSGEKADVVWVNLDYRKDCIG